MARSIIGGHATSLLPGFAAFLSSGSSDCLIGGLAVSAAPGEGAVRGEPLAILSGDHDRFGLESTATGHDVALDVDNAIRAYLTGKTVKNQSLLHEGGNGSRGETFGSVAANQAEDAEKGHQVKQVSRKLHAGGLLGRGEVRTLKVKQVSRKLQAGVLLGRGEACADHTECAVGKCKGHRGQGMECRVKLADCKRYGTHSTKRWGCPDGGACALTKDLKWGSCTAAPTGGPTSIPSTSPTDAPSASPTSSPTESPTSIPTTTPTETPITYGYEIHYKYTVALEDVYFAKNGVRTIPFMDSLTYMGCTVTQPGGCDGSGTGPWDSTGADTDTGCFSFSTHSILCDHDIHSDEVHINFFHTYADQDPPAPGFTVKSLDASGSLIETVADVGSPSGVNACTLLDGTGKSCL